MRTCEHANMGTTKRIANKTKKFLFTFARRISNMYAISYGSCTAWIKTVFCLSSFYDTNTLSLSISALAFMYKGPVPIWEPAARPRILPANQNPARPKIKAAAQSAKLYVWSRTPLMCDPSPLFYAWNLFKRACPGVVARRCGNPNVKTRSEEYCPPWGYLQRRAVPLEAFSKQFSLRRNLGPFPSCNSMVMRAGRILFVWCGRRRS